MKEPINATKFYIAAVFLATLALIVFVQAAFNLTPFISPSLPSQTILLYSLSTFIFLVLIVFAFVLLRSLIKLWVERKSEKPGSKFKTRLVVSLILLTLVPATFLFLFAFGLVNRSIDKWFSVPVDEIFYTTEQIVGQWREQSRLVARDILTHVESQPLEQLDSVRESFRLKALLLLDQDGKPIARSAERGTDLELFSAPILNALQNADETFIDLEQYWIGARRTAKPARILAVVFPKPDRILALASKIADERAKYQELVRDRRYYRDTYVYILLLITVLVLFAAVWIGLFLSKRITIPIEALAEATREISAGNLDHRVSIKAEDELDMLVGLFNDMTEQLQSTTRELEARRRYTEIILETIPTGVISVGKDLHVNKINRPARTMFSTEGAETLDDIFTTEDRNQIHELLRIAEQEGTATREVAFTGPGRPAHSAVSASRLTAGGFVLVVEDLTEVVKAQKATAWREVARRLAHEIKNPLTPIQLSAERISRNVLRLPAATPRVTMVIQECVDAIIEEVNSLKNLVDEFVRFARLPAVSRQPTDMRILVEKTLALYDDRIDGTMVLSEVPPDLPLVLMDLQQMKRVLINLIDNALEAMAGETTKELKISCTLARDGTMARMTVSDTGHGIAPDDRERLFTPYFSTRKNGTGLGLAIASRIVAEHGGYIGVESNTPRGTRFVIELPVCQKS